MTSYLNKFLRNMAALEIKTLSPLSPKGTFDAKPFGLWWQETPPYGTNRVVEDLPLVGATAQDQLVRSYTFVGRIVAGHLKGSYDGWGEELLYEYIPAIDAAVESNYWMMDENGLIIPEIHPVGIEFVRCNGMQVFVNTGIPGAPQQIGTEFRLTATFEGNNETEYSGEGGNTEWS